MSKSIQELAQEMSEGEFLKYVDNKQLCPHEFKLSIADGIVCDSGDTIDLCHECWNEATKDIKFKDNSLELFQKESLQILNQLAESEKTYKELGTQRDNLKSQLLELMDKYDLNKWENDKFSVTYVKAGTTTSIDSAKVKKLYPEIFQECSKTSNRKASIRFKVK